MERNRPADSLLTVEGALLVERDSLRDLISIIVRRSIFSGAFRPGEKINQADLARTVGTSPVPVREAIAALQREGFVIYEPRKGFRVSNLSREDISDHFMMLGFASGEIAKRAAERARDSEIAGLQASVSRTSVGLGPRARWAAHDEFHRILNRSARSRRLAYLVATLSDGFPFELYADVGRWSRATDLAHRDLCDAIEKRDAGRARQLMENHVHTNASFAVEYMERTGFWSPNDGGKTHQ